MGGGGQEVGLDRLFFGELQEFLFVAGDALVEVVDKAVYLLVSLED